ncbi:hypothetical protein M0R72_19200 [Candidatus Pacearchaeota archaeon]|jgi:hypothetical protein|nr:hypothetical protein [Candidatus Pacearchaeota archaeon]
MNRLPMLMVRIANDVSISMRLREELKSGSVESVHIRRTGNGDLLSIDYVTPEGYKP